jgi:hypothetical protein
MRSSKVSACRLFVTKFERKGHTAASTLAGESRLGTSCDSKLMTLMSWSNRRGCGCRVSPLSPRREELRSPICY